MQRILQTATCSAWTSSAATMRLPQGPGFPAPQRHVAVQCTDSASCKLHAACLNQQRCHQEAAPGAWVPSSTTTCSSTMHRQLAWWECCQTEHYYILAAVLLWPTTKAAPSGAGHGLRMCWQTTFALVCSACMPCRHTSVGKQPGFEPPCSTHSASGSAKAGMLTLARLKRSRWSTPWP